MKVGDKVLVLDDAISGAITEVKGSSITILTEEDFEMQFNENELVVVEESLSEKDFIPKNISAVLSEKETKKKKNTPRVKPKERFLPPMVVDLHIHQLVSNHWLWPSGCKATHSTRHQFCLYSHHDSFDCWQRG